MTRRGTLVGGIGNVFLGDDGFGVEVVKRLAARPPRAGVQIADFGIRSFDLLYALCDYDDVILVDALPRAGGGPPGTLYVIEPDVQHGPLAGTAAAGLAAHGFAPAAALALALGREAGGGPARVRIVGCEPGAIPAEGDVAVGLSPPVAEAAERAVALVEELLDA